MNPIPDSLIELMRSARRIVALTGAGISAESGVPTFRDANSGLWATYNPAELATPAAFQANPWLVWSWYCWRRDRVLAVRPNAGHHALVELQTQCPGFLLVTQNVDRLHQRAGSRHVIELHGNMMRARCFENGHIADEWPEPVAGNNVPRCKRCHSAMRPDVVWFGEALPGQELQRATDAASRCDMFISIGTSSVVYPAAGIVQAAIHNSATIVEINPRATPLTAAADYVLADPAGEMLPILFAKLARSK